MFYPASDQKRKLISNRWASKLCVVQKLISRSVCQTATFRRTTWSAFRRESIRGGLIYGNIARFFR